MSTILRRLIFSFSILGFLFFTGLFSLSYINPLFVEQTAKEFIRIRLTDTTNEKINSLSDHALINKARKMLNENNIEINKLKQQLADKIPGRIDTVMTSMLDPSCGDRKAYEKFAKERAKANKTQEIKSLSEMQSQLTSFIQGKYIEISQNLHREFRIFTGTNSIAFLILIVSILIQRIALFCLFIPASCLLISTAIVAYFYLFQQNWLNTILFSDYLGFGYVAFIFYIFFWAFSDSLLGWKMNLYEKKVKTAN